MDGKFWEGARTKGTYTMEKHVMAFGSCRRWDRIILGCMEIGSPVAGVEQLHSYSCVFMSK